MTCGLIKLSIGLAASGLAGCASADSTCTGTALRSLSKVTTETRVETDPVSGGRLMLIHRETVSACLTGGEP
jgi:hypothetical protein